MRAPQLNCSVVALLFVTLVFGALFTGCTSTGPRAQREIALLRAEILDLEDQFYWMKSQYESANRELQMCNGVPVDGSYLGSTIIEGEYIDGGFVEGEYVEGEYIEGEIIDYGSPEEIVYDVPARTGRYIPHATATFRESARRLFGRSNVPSQSQRQVQPNQRRGFGLFNGLGLGLFRRSEPVESTDNFDPELEIVVPPIENQASTTRPTLASTPLATNSANQPDSYDTNSTDLDISFGDEPIGDYSPQDNVVFDKVDNPIARTCTGATLGAVRSAVTGPINR